jgi:DNA-directed RNA polymerase specialized sigma subunit
VVELRFFHDLTNVEIAERLGISPSYVSYIMGAALERLRAAMAGAGDDHDGDDGADIRAVA